MFRGNGGNGGAAGGGKSNGAARRSSKHNGNANGANGAANGAAAANASSGNNTGGAASNSASKPGTTVKIVSGSAVESLVKANQDITALHIAIKDVKIGERVATAFVNLLRGYARTWEGVAVDMLRQKARWESIAIEECSGSHVDTCIATIIAIDNVQALTLGSLKMTPHASNGLGMLGFSNRLEKLQLDLLDLSTTVTPLSSALKQNKSIKSCSFSRCGLNDEQIAQLIGALEEHPALQELKIFGNKCRGRGLQAITNVVKHKNTSIQVLDLSYQHVGDGENFDINWLCSALAKNTTLRVLDLDNDSIDDGHLAHIAAALTENSSLEELMLNHNKITGEGVSLLAANFSKMKGLKKISMYSNQFG